MVGPGRDLGRHRRGPGRDPRAVVGPGARAGWDHRVRLPDRLQPDATRRRTPTVALYASDCGAARVYRIAPDGVSVVIGSGPGGFAAGFKGDGGPATEAETLCPFGIAFDPEGRLLLVDHGNNRVRRVDAAGVISTIAGSGPGNFQGGFEGDGGPATEGLMQEPTFIAVGRRRATSSSPTATTTGSGGSASMASSRPWPGTVTRRSPARRDSGTGDRRRRPAWTTRRDWPWTTPATSTSRTPTTTASAAWAPDGVIETIAGTGEFGSDGDGGPATEATISDPESLLLDKAGNLYVGDPERRTASASSARTGSSRPSRGPAGGHGGDGGPATEATLRLGGDPASLAIDASGNVYIGDSGNHVIRVVDPSGHHLDAGRDGIA